MIEKVKVQALLWCRARRASRRLEKALAAIKLHGEHCALRPHVESNCDYLRILRTEMHRLRGARDESRNAIKAFRTLAKKGK